MWRVLGSSDTPQATERHGGQSPLWNYARAGFNEAAGGEPILSRGDLRFCYRFGVRQSSFLLVRFETRMVQRPSFPDGTQAPSSRSRLFPSPQPQLGLEHVVTAIIG